VCVCVCVYVYIHTLTGMCVCVYMYAHLLDGRGGVGGLSLKWGIFLQRDELLNVRRFCIISLLHSLLRCS